MGAPFNRLGAIDLPAQLLGDIHKAEKSNPLFFQRMRGQWVEMNTDEIKAAIDLWKAQSRGDLSPRDLIQRELEAKAPPDTLPFDGVNAEGWVDDLLQRLQVCQTLETQAAPAGFVGAAAISTGEGPTQRPKTRVSKPAFLVR